MGMEPDSNLDTMSSLMPIHRARAAPVSTCATFTLRHGPGNGRFIAASGDSPKIQANCHPTRRPLDFGICSTISSTYMWLGIRVVTSWLPCRTTNTRYGSLAEASRLTQANAQQVRLSGRYGRAD